MKGKLLLISCFLSMQLFAQNDTTVVDISKEIESRKSWSDEQPHLKVFYGQRLINAKTVEVLHKGVMAFTVVHNFGDIASENGGTKNFFGLDDISDAQIGFQLGLTNRFNVLLQHTVGNGAVRKFYELGLKYQFVKQETNGAPFSLTAYGNIVSTADKVLNIDSTERSFQDASDRLSELLQVMIARRFGPVSLQLSGTLLHTNLVFPGDQNNVLAIGGALRLPLSKKIFLISDYFHSFRTTESTQAMREEGIDPHDVFGIGIEILTQGHMFHLNFTNARNILENRFLTHTTESWGDGEFRWGFTLTRNFVIFRDKKNK
ncbi:MAG TPA: DUF5777 family beta-barrel protein [Chitinophagaceae bacterium]|nr:DUF5777 family beta-barrel protein [Chitinophagaceae bacterium]